MSDQPTDEDLLVGSVRDADDFGALYDRHAQELLGFFARRTADAHVAAELTAETFAQAFVSRRRFTAAGDGSARAWLFGIGRHQLGRYARRQRVSDRYRRKLGMERVALDDEAATRIDELGQFSELRPALRDALASLSPTLLAAVQLRVLDDLPYAEVARRLGCSEGAARVRVTRALSQLADVLEVPR